MDTHMTLISSCCWHGDTLVAMDALAVSNILSELQLTIDERVSGVLRVLNQTQMLDQSPECKAVDQNILVHDLTFHEE